MQGKPFITELFPLTPKLDDLITQDWRLEHKSSCQAVQNEVLQDSRTTLSLRALLPLVASRVT